MNTKQRLLSILIGFLLGTALTSAVWLSTSPGLHRETAAEPPETGTETSTEPSEVGTETSTEPPENGTETSAEPPENGTELPADVSGTAPVENTSPPESTGHNSSDAPEHSTDSGDGSENTWSSTQVYLGGDIVSYQNRLYRARWWTQGEQPDTGDVWESLGVLSGEAVQPQDVANTPIDASVPRDTDLTDFKVVGYYPSWKPDKLSFVDFGILTHVCYAFAIPTAEGGLRDLENPETARELIRSAHDNGVKVLLSVGGWSYNDTPLEGVFLSATSDESKIRQLADSIFAMCGEYGFDGVDMDWEHPRVDGGSAGQYEALMLTLAQQLHAQDKLLTAAVLSGATPDGGIYYDAAAHTNAVLNAVDFINVMAYDGGDGERHSPYQFTVDCGTYWHETRKVPACKIVMGVPFYTRPGWADYAAVLESVPDAYNRDHVTYNGMEVYYNGMDTIAAKTDYALENLGGIMIWELTQDTADREKSLLQTIRKTILAFPDSQNQE